MLESGKLAKIVPFSDHTVWVQDPPFNF